MLRAPYLTEAHLAQIRARLTLTAFPRILLIGNSATIQGGFLAHLRAAALAEHPQAQIARASANAARLAGSLRIGELRRLVSQHSWDVVVLQDFSSTALARRERLASRLAIAAFAQLAAPAPVVLFPHWPSAPGHRVYRSGFGPRFDIPSDPADYAARSRDHYAAAAWPSRITVAPVLDLWLAAPESAALYAPDLHHANDAGGRVAATAVWSEIRATLARTGQSPLSPA